MQNKTKALDSDVDDNEENYRNFLAYMINQTKSRGNTRYFRQHVKRCKDRAALIFPIGAAEAAKSDLKRDSKWGAFAFLAAIFGA